jgi:hypothetical protein
VRKYVTTLQEYLQEHRFLEKIIGLQQRFNTYGCTDDLITKYNELDKLRLTGVLLANKKCRKVKLGQVSFSPAMVDAWNRIKAWQLIKKKLSGGRVNSRYYRRALKAAGLSDLAVTTSRDAEAHLSKAWTIYKVLKKQGRTLRATWLEELAVARAEDGNTSVAQEIKNLTMRETQRREARQIKFILKPGNRKGLSSIEVQEAGEWIELTQQQDIEKALLRELRTRFNQASDTPFQSEPLLSLVGPLGTTEYANDILRGAIEPPDNMDVWAVKLLPFLLQQIPVVEISDLTPSQYAASWKKVKEKTSAGPSGLTIPHMKAHGSSEYITAINTIMANLPFRFGFSPQRWQKGLDVMLEKKPGVRQLPTLRAILLYEADFNQNNKRLGREMLYRAEDGNMVAIEQFGSRQHMSAIDQSLNKTLTFDIWRQ